VHHLWYVHRESDITFDLQLLFPKAQKDFESGCRREVHTEGIGTSQL